MQHGDELLARGRLPLGWTCQPVWLIWPYWILFHGLLYVHIPSFLLEHIWAFSLKKFHYSDLFFLGCDTVPGYKERAWPILLTSWKLVSWSSFEDELVAQQSSAQAIQHPEAAVGKHWLDRSFSFIAQRPRPVALLLHALHVALHQICSVFCTLTTDEVPTDWEILI